MTEQPTLTPGDHPGQVGACVMEMVSLIAARKITVVDGKVTAEWKWPGKTDLPDCTTPVVAKAAQEVNDQLDSEAWRTAQLIPRLLRARRCVDPEVERRVSLRVACWAARSVLHLVPEADRGVAEAAIDAAEVCLADPSPENRDRAYAATCAAYTAATATAAAANASYAATYAAYTAAAAGAAATAAYTAAAAAAADGDPVLWLSDLLDAHEKALAEEGEPLWDPEADYLADDEITDLIDALTPKDTL